MKKNFQTIIEKNPNANIIPPEELDIIRIKLGKSKRKESDWTIIKDILYKHDLIVMEPEKKDRYLPEYDHIMSEDGVLVAFTSIDECMKHVRWLNEEDGTPGRGFLIGSLPFEQIIRTADEYGLDLIIDPAMDGRTRCMLYLPDSHEIKAATMLS